MGLAVADDLAAGDFHVADLVGHQHVGAFLVVALGAQACAVLQQQVHVAAQADIAGGIDHVVAGRHHHRSAGRGQRVDGVLECSGVVGRAITAGAPVAHVQRGAAAQARGR